MSDKPTGQKQYKSPTTGDYCTASQYIAEICCVKEAKVNKQVLVHKFWNTKEWKKKYINYITAANALIRRFHPQAIINVIQRKEYARFYSLRFHKIIEAIEAENKVILIKEKALLKQTAKAETEVKKPTTFSQNKSIISGLKD